MNLVLLLLTIQIVMLLYMYWYIQNVQKCIFVRLSLRKC